MPSWNIHTAHVERLLRDHSAEELGISDPNAFLMGNLVPDLYVGYMVPDTSIRIDYKLTHLTFREHIPLPDHRSFWDFYVAHGPSPATDLTLGAWSHLVADHVYNQHTRRLIASLGLSPSDAIREAKQADFTLFGRTLRISAIPEPTDVLIEQCRLFPPYSIAESDLRRAAAVARGIIEDNQARHLDAEPHYEMLNHGFFESAFDETNRIVVQGLAGRLQ